MRGILASNQSRLVIVAGSGVDSLISGHRVRSIELREGVVDIGEPVIRIVIDSRPRHPTLLLRDRISSF